MTVLDMDKICANCGFTWGSHRGDSADYGACPAHEGRMDWNEAPGTHWAPSQAPNAYEAGSQS